MTKTKKTTKGRPSRRAPKAGAPALVHTLLDAYLHVDRATVNAAFQHARMVIAKEHLEQVEDVCDMTEQAARAYLEELAPEVLDAEEWGMHSGTIHAAIGDPSFCLGFSLAYLLFAERATVDLRGMAR